MIRMPVSFSTAHNLRFFSDDLKYRLRKLFEQTLELVPIYTSRTSEQLIMFRLQIFFIYFVSNFVYHTILWYKIHEKLLVSGTFDASMIISYLSPVEVVSLSMTKGSTGYPSVAITVKLCPFIYNL